MHSYGAIYERMSGISNIGEFPKINEFTSNTRSTIRVYHLVDNIENPEQDLQVKFSKWCPYSTDTQFRIPYDGILAVGQPDTGLSLAYQAKIQLCLH